MLGLCVLAWVIVRIPVRLPTKAPPITPAPPAWQGRASRSVHLALYGLMLAMPLAGWAILSASGKPVPPMPELPPAEAEVGCSAASGRYRLPGLGLVTLGRDGERLIVRVADGPRYTVFAVGHATLYVPGLDAYLTLSQGGELRWDSLLRSAAGRRLTAS